MRPPFSAADIDRFRGGIAYALGLQFEDARLGFLAEVLGRRLDTTRDTLDVYLARLETESLSTDEARGLSQELTVPETYFFRNSDQFRAFTDLALPDRMRAQAATRRLRILSAGCASGEEAYSLAILVREAGLDPSWDVSILGIDVNPAIVSKATRALFSEWALRETPADVRQRWFTPVGRGFLLDDTVRAAVTFEERNLVRDEPHLWPPDSYDIVFFRNVLMYFTPENGQAVVTRIERALRPGGYLFLGVAETLRGLSTHFHLRHTHETFYYQRRDDVKGTTLQSSATTPSHGLTRTVMTAVEGADTWIDAIRRASERIETLTHSPQQPASSRDRSSRAAARPTWDLDLARQLLQQERFAEALDSVQRLPPESGRDPDVLLLHAALLTHRGQLADAEAACRRLLDVDELSAGAHYLLALCREGARDRTGAVNHDQVAIYLDPSFAMPHLHLGLLARRAGDHAAARTELGQALPLLQREDSSRVLLFGGGFSRGALVALCRTELAGCVNPSAALTRLA
jgi:chemotaxis protein methyltransferase CheR